MFRAKALIFMIPLLLPIGQPPADATDRSPSVDSVCPPRLSDRAVWPEETFLPPVFE